MLEKLPSAEVSSIIQYLQQQLRIADAVAATKDILGVLAEHQSDDQVCYYYYYNDKILLEMIMIHLIFIYYYY